MLELTFAAMLSVGTAGPAIRQQRVVLSGASETPLPDAFEPTALHQLPTQGLAPARSILSELNDIDQHLRAAGVLGINAEDQALVSRVVAENMPKATTKRVLARRK